MKKMSRSPGFPATVLGLLYSLHLAFYSILNFQLGCKWESSVPPCLGRFHSIFIFYPLSTRKIRTYNKKLEVKYLDTSDGISLLEMRQVHPSRLNKTLNLSPEDNPGRKVWKFKAKVLNLAQLTFQLCTFNLGMKLSLTPKVKSVFSPGSFTST